MGNHVEEDEVNNNGGDDCNNNNNNVHGVNFSTQRDFVTKLKSGLKETFFPDDPFRQFKEEEKQSRRFIKGVQYFVPIFEWLPNYNIRTFFSDLVAGLTITSLAIPQGISYAKLANLPPLIGLCKSQNHFILCFSS